MSVYEKLLNVQSELKAPKNQFNSFGKYNYRNCEDILEAVKPIALKYKAVVIVGDSLEMVGNRFYIKSTAEFIDVETGERVIENAYAREEDSKKGMDASQVTGAASSYARKYALNGLLCIDDTKDADTPNKGNGDKEDNSSGNKDAQHSEKVNLDEPATQAHKNVIKKECEKHKIKLDVLYQSNGITEETLTARQAINIINSFKKKYGDE